MSTAELKSNLHQLIENIEEPKLLEALYDTLSERKDAKPGELWNNLSPEQQNEVLKSYEESEDENNLRSWEDVKGKFQ